MNLTKTKKKVRSSYYCCVENCGNLPCNNPNVSFHHFPTEKTRIPQKNYFDNLEYRSVRQLWIKSLNIRRKITTNLRVCSNHFNKDDFFSSGTVSKLKRNAVPKLDLSNENKELKAKNKNRSDRLSQRHVKKVLMDITNERILGGNEEQALEDVNNKDEVEKCNETEDNIEETNSDEKQVESNEIVECSEMIENEEESRHDMELNSNEFVELPPVVKSTSSIGIQTNASVFIELPPVVKSTSSIGIQTNASSFFDTINTTPQLVTLTGIPDLETLDLLIKIVIKMKPSLATVKIFSARDKIMATMMKLKHNISYALLALLLKCSARNCCMIVNDILDILGTALKKAIKWPSKDQILSNIPNCFENFKNVRVVVDCTEIAIQRPKNLCCQVLSYSQYKGKETVKIMTGVSPGGTITFVSKVYGGRASDTFIFKTSGIMSLLEEKDGVMTDKGFLIDQQCENNNWTLIRPPFLKDKVRFSKEEALLNSSIACARVHVERCNQRMKEFKVLGDKMPAALFPKCQQIITVISAVVNLSLPIFKDDKFIN